MIRALWLLLASFFASSSWAFTEQDLAQQLAASQVLRGDFVQEKYLRGLSMPLTSSGTFVLANKNGLLWFVDKPIQKKYRITAIGVAAFEQGVWVLQSGQDAASRQSRLFLAVLEGDQQGLREDFHIQLTGSAQEWVLELEPKSLLLQQIFTRILVRGDLHVRSIELIEAQGDRTLMRMQHIEQVEQLNADEQQAFAA